jgi:hypothetical protein
MRAMMNDLNKERQRLNTEIQLCKNLIKQNVSAIGSGEKSHIEIMYQFSSNPVATLHLIDQLTDTFLPHDHKINKTLKGVKMGVELVGGILSHHN